MRLTQSTCILNWIVLSFISCFRIVEAIIFTKDLKDIKLTKGGVKNITLECEISKPGLRLDWYLGKKKLRRGDKYDIIADGTVHKLVIEEVEEELAGEYKAVYENLETKGSLIIESKYHPHVFYFVAHHCNSLYFYK